MRFADEKDNGCVFGAVLRFCKVEADRDGRVWRSACGAEQCGKEGRRHTTRTNVRDRRDDGASGRETEDRERERRWEWTSQRLTQSSVPQLMFAGPGKPAGAMTNVSPGHFTCNATCVSSLEHLAAPWLYTHRTAPRNAQNRALEIARHAHNHTDLQHVALVTTDCLLTELLAERRRWDWLSSKTALNSDVARSVGGVPRYKCVRIAHVRVAIEKRAKFKRRYRSYRILMRF